MRLNTVQFGLTDACNLACTWCQNPELFTGREPALPGRRPGMMDLDLFRKVLADLREWPEPIPVLFLAWIGESLLHPRFLEFVVAAFEANTERRFFETLSVNTNGVPLDGRLARGLVSAAAAHPETVFQIGLSLDCLTPETFRITKGKDHGDRVNRQVETFLGENAAAGHPIVVHITMLVVPETEGETTSFVDHWSAVLGRHGYAFQIATDSYAPSGPANKIFLKRAILPDQVSHDGLHQRASERSVLARLSTPEGGGVPISSPSLRTSPASSGASTSVAAARDPERSAAEGAPGRTPTPFVSAESRSFDYASQHLFVAQPTRPPCPALWSYPVVHHDGRVTVCCKDIHLGLVIGDLRERSFRDLFEDGEEIRRLRERHVDGDFHMIPECGPCGNYDVPGLPSHEVSAWLTARGETERRDRFVRRMESVPGTGSYAEIRERVRRFLEERPRDLIEVERAAATFRAQGEPGFARELDDLAEHAQAAALRDLLVHGFRERARALLSKALEMRWAGVFDEAVLAYGAAVAAGRFDEAAERLVPLADAEAEAFPSIAPLVAAWSEAREAAGRVRGALLLRYGILRDLGHAYFRAGRHAEAIVRYDRARVGAPADERRILDKQSAFCRFHLDEPAEARSLAERALEAGPDFEMFRLLGHLSLRAGRTAPAADFFERAVALHPGDEGSRLGLLRASFGSGRYARVRDLALGLLEAVDVEAREAARATLATPELRGLHAPRARA